MKFTTDAFPHFRSWKIGQISSSAKDRIESLLKHERAKDARAMAGEWIINIKG
jgi:hypothetical protein